MNKLVIPSILLATVVVAGLFAFMPVEQASTVHSSAEVLDARVTILVDENVNLPDDGTDVACTVTTDEDALIMSLFVDSTPTVETVHIE